MSLTDAQVAEIAGMTTGTSLGGRARDLAREVQASRKLIADLRALPYTAVTCELLRQMIDRADL